MYSLPEKPLIDTVEFCSIRARLQNVNIDELITYPFDRGAVVPDHLITEVFQKRTFIKCPGIYVLRLANGQIYVGLSGNMAKRILSHVLYPSVKVCIENGGPIAVEAVYAFSNRNRSTGAENEVCIDLARKYGYTNVYGGTFISNWGRDRLREFAVNTPATQ